MRKLIIICLMLLTATVAFSQDKKSDKQKNQSTHLDPINKLAPNNKPVTHDSIAVMTAEQVAVTASKKDVKKARRLLAEQQEVGELTRELIEQFKFRFEPYYARYKTEYRSQGYLGAIRCYGGVFYSSLDFIPFSNEEQSEINMYDEFHGYSSYSNEMGYRQNHEYRFTDFAVENIHEDPKEEDIILFDVCVNQPVTIDGRTENPIKFNFALNYKNGKMSCAIEGETRHYAKYYGYLTALR